MTVHIIGLGPGRAGLLTAETVELLRSGTPVILRTRHHPTVDAVDAGRTFADCDDLYAALPGFEDVYTAIVERVVAAAKVGDVVYAVPGHPLVAERSVSLLVAALAGVEIPMKIYPAVSFVDAAASALGLDFGTIQVCDALDLRIDAQRPALISQVHDRDGATDLKLRLIDIYPPSHELVVLSDLGTDAASSRTVPLADLDHRPFGYLDTVYVPALAPIEDVRRLDGLKATVSRLHAPDGCPWDLEQTHQSLRKHLLEEAYETLEAIDSGEPARLAEELGDLLLQVFMHAEVADRNGAFTLGDITEHIARKLIHRHPHVFADGEAKTADDVAANWERLKQGEKPRESVLDGVPATLPALAASQTIQGRARRIGFDWPDIEGPLEKLAEEIGEFARADAVTEREDEFGDILFVIANIGQRLGVDAEQALRGANAKFRRRFGAVEALARDRSLDLRDLDLPGLDELWDEVKREERAGRL